METKNLKIRVSELEVHQEVTKTFKKKEMSIMEFSMNRFGQEQPITVVESNNKYFIIDGLCRFEIAKKHNLETLDCTVVNLPIEEVLNTRIRINQKLKVDLEETCRNAEHILGILGDSQGKKREKLGFKDFDSEENFGLIGKDRYELTCMLLGLDFKASTLRQLMFVYWDWKSSDKNDSDGVFEALNQGIIKIHKAHSLLKSKQTKDDRSKQIELQDYEGKISDVSYQLFNKSSLDLSDIPDGTLKLSIQSPPYFQLRKYRNQDLLIHGQEKSVEEYIQNEIKFYRGLKPKLTKDGVLVVNIGETYRGGYQGVCSKLETALRKDGWNIIDVNIWVKKNPKSQPHKNRFLPSYERIIVCSLNEVETFNDQYKPSSTGKSKIIRGTGLKNGSTGFSMSHEISSIPNVIITSVFQKSEFENVDPTFKHDAPCPLEIYNIFIKAYSNPNDTILDMFSGSGQGILSAIRNGRNAIGYDVDPVSIEFTHKRLQVELNKRQEFKLQIAA